MVYKPVHLRCHREEEALIRTSEAKGFKSASD